MLLSMLKAVVVTILLLMEIVLGVLIVGLLIALGYTILTEWKERRDNGD